MKKISDLKPNPRNPRKIQDSKKQMLIKSLNEFGDLSGVVFNKKTNRLVGGHQRVSIIEPSHTIIIENTYDVPTRTGTVAEGFIDLDGEKLRYREVNWDEQKEKAANIAANKGAGDWDFPLLIDMLNDLDAMNFDLDLTMFDDKERDTLLGGVSELDTQEKEETKEQTLFECQECGAVTEKSKLKKVTKGE